MPFWLHHRLHGRSSFVARTARNARTSRLLSQDLLAAEGFSPKNYPVGSERLNAAPLKAGFDGDGIASILP